MLRYTRTSIINVVCYMYIFVVSVEASQLYNKHFIIHICTPTILDESKPKELDEIYYSHVCFF